MTQTIERRLKIPFYLNHGHKCAQVATKCALGAVIPERNFSFRKLEELMGHEGEQITYPIQLASGLEELGVKFSYFVKPRYQEIINNKELFLLELRKCYGENTEKLLSVTNYESLVKSAERLSLSESVIERSERLSIDELREISKIGILLPLVNFDVLVGRENHYSGHYLVITRIGEETINYHETGPIGAEPNKKISIKRFIDSWNLCFLDWDLVVVNR